MTDFLGRHWLELITAAYLIGMMLYGHYRGFIKIAVSVMALVISILLANMALPYASSFLKQNTPIEKNIREIMLDNIGIEDIDFEETGNANAQQHAIESLKLPVEVKKMLSVNNSPETWKKLGVEAFSEYLGKYVSNLIFNLIGFVFLFIVIWLILHIVLGILDVFTKLPVIHGLNQIAGAFLGLAQGLMCIWIICMFIAAFSGVGTGSYLLAKIEDSLFLKILFDNNLLSFYLRGLIYFMF